MKQVLSCVLLAVLLAVLPASAQPPAAQLRADVQLHAGPGLAYPVIGDLPAQTLLTLEGRSASGLWVYVSLANGAAHGWLASGLLDLPGSISLRDLPVIETPADPPPPSLWTMTSYTTDPELLAIMDRLQTTPVLYNMDTDVVDEIFRRGQALGNRANVFTRAGDSDTTSGDYLRPMGMIGHVCDLGAYSYLQETVDFFRATSPRLGVRNSFDNTSAAAINGLSMTSVLDPFWAREADCQSRESPLACEYRRTRPAVAVIMLGRMDVEIYDAETYRVSTERVIQASMDAGVIPVFTTFVVLPDIADWPASIRFNGVLVDVVEQYGVPLINLWAVLQGMEGFGIGPDRVHLSHAVGAFCTFTGAELTYGGTLRNLLVLQALDELRRSTLDSR